MIFFLIYFINYLSLIFQDVDEASKKEIKEILLQHDRTLLVADPRRREPKKFGGFYFYFLEQASYKT